MACSDGTPRKDISMLKSLLFPSFRRNRTSHCLPVNCQLSCSRLILFFCCLFTLHWSAGGPVTIVFSASTTFVHASWSSSSTYSQNHHFFVINIANITIITAKTILTLNQETSFPPFSFCCCDLKCS